MTLKKLIHYGKEDISDKKLYWDSEKKQIRHKAHCEYCNADIGCMCYDTTNEAFEGIDQGFLCDKCYIKNEMDRDLTLEDIINHLTDETAKKVLYFVLENMDDEDIKGILLHIEHLPSFDDCADFYGRPCKI